MPIGSFYTDISNKIITPVPNRVKIWNAFTGKPDNTFAPVSDAEISAI